MATQLFSIVRFVNVAPGGMAVLPHGLAWSAPGGGELPQTPDFMTADLAGWTVTADDTNVTVTNNQAVAASTDIWCWLINTPDRAFGDAAIKELVPRPFVLNQGGSGGVGSDITYLPDRWEKNDVAANLVDDVVASSVSQLFDEIPVTRTVSVLGIRTQLTEAITAGTLTVTVFINGVATAAALVHTSASNPSGGGVTFAPGVAVAAPGQTIGVRVTTDAGFLPDGSTDLSVLVEVGAA